MISIRDVQAAMFKGLENNFGKALFSRAKTMASEAWS